VGVVDILPAHPFTAREARDAGVTEHRLYALLNDGVLERIGHGLYHRTDAEHPVDLDLAPAAKRAPRATLCLTSALAHHGLTDTIPHWIDLALPRGTRKPRVENVRWHLFDVDTFDIGRSTIPVLGTPFSVGIYSPERTIADCFRLRDVTGYEIAIEALRNWLPRRGSNPVALLNIAQQLPRARTPVRDALNYLS
jgi:predicted transcriptional regulator of viral defense system